MESISKPKSDRPQPPSSRPMPRQRQSQKRKPTTRTSLLMLASTTWAPRQGTAIQMTLLIVMTGEVAGVMVMHRAGVGIEAIVETAETVETAGIDLVTDAGAGAGVVTGYTIQDHARDLDRTVGINGLEIARTLVRRAERLESTGMALEGVETRLSQMDGTAVAAMAGIIAAPGRGHWTDTTIGRGATGGVRVRLIGGRSPITDTRGATGMLTARGAVDGTTIVIMTDDNLMAIMSNAEMVDVMTVMVGMTNMIAVGRATSRRTGAGGVHTRAHPPVGTNNTTTGDPGPHRDLALALEQTTDPANIARMSDSTATGPPSPSVAASHLLQERDLLRHYLAPMFQRRGPAGMPRHVDPARAHVHGPLHLLYLATTRSTPSLSHAPLLLPPRTAQAPDWPGPSSHHCTAVLSATSKISYLQMQKQQKRTRESSKRHSGVLAMGWDCKRASARKCYCKAAEMTRSRSGMRGTRGIRITSR